MKFKDKNNFDEEDDISLQMLREEERDVGDYSEEESDNKQVFIYLILGVITLVLCGVSFVIGVNVGQNNEKRHAVTKEETVLSSNTQNTKPITNLDDIAKSSNPSNMEKKPAQGTSQIQTQTAQSIAQSTAQVKPEQSQIEIKEVDKNTNQLMILQNAKNAANKQNVLPKKPGSETTANASPTIKTQPTGSTKPAPSPSPVSEATKPQEPSSASAAGKNFTIQIKATEDKDQAETLKKSFVQKGYDAFISVVTVKDKTFYRVRLGKYASENEAMVAAEELKRKENLKDELWITKL